MGLGFLSPLFLIGVLAAAVPIALHLFRQQSGAIVPFSAVRFVPRAPLHRARRRHLQDLLLLALRVTAIVLLAVSFARPYVNRVQADAGPLTIIALDRSYSMSAPGRMARARALALDAVNETSGRVAVVTFDERARTVLPPTTDRGEARRVLEGVSSGHAGTRYRAALAEAAELIGAEHGRVVLVSDLQESGWGGEMTSAIPDAVEVVVRDVGPLPENLFVSALRRTPSGLVAEVRSTAATERETRAVLALEGRRVAEQRLTVPPGGSAEVTFAETLPARGGVSVAIDDPAGLASDNVRHAVLDPFPRPRLLVVVDPREPEQGLYVTAAVTAAEGPGGMAVETLPADRLSTRTDGLQGYAAVVLLGSRGFDARAGEALAAAIAAGAGVIMAAGPGLDWSWLAAQLPSSLRVRADGVETLTTPVALAPTDVRHPVFRTADNDAGWVGAPRFSRILRIAPGSAGSGGRVLARFTNGAPALVELEADPGRVVFFASDLANRWNDFALQPAFVPFVHALVRHVARQRPVVREVYVGTRLGSLWAEPGVVMDPSGPAPETRVAVNVDLRESDPSRMTPEVFLASVPRTADPASAGPARVAPAAGRGTDDERAMEAGQSWWQYGLVLMLIGLVIESAVGRRR